MRKFLYIDWDLTVVEFPHAKGVEDLEQYLVGDIVAMSYALRIAKYLDAVFDEVLCFTRTGAPVPTALRLHTLLAHTLLGSFHEGLYWSREFWMLDAEKGLGIALDPELIGSAVDAYWEGVGSHTQIYPDARDFFEQKSEIFDGIVIVTSTDARVRPDEARGFVYDPEFSKQQKVIRMRRSADVERLLDSYVSHVVIGDPYGKGTPDFWAEADEAVGRTLKDHVVIIGDSYENDVVCGKKFVPNATGVLIQREGAIHPDRYPEADRVVPSLTQISDDVMLA